MTAALHHVTGTVDVVVIGAGHSGLAMSHRLSAMSVDHVVLERGEVANAWRTERWDSLRLLTPNWLTRLPGQAYTGNDPDGFMDMAGVVDFVAAYARTISAPVQTNTTVLSVTRADEDYLVETNRGTWRARAVVLASGAFNKPNIPTVARDLPAAVNQLTPHEYKRPGQLPDGGVLVVGASATGLQIADELQRSGRDVTLASGEHVRMPRHYRGRDVQWWMQASGLLDEGIETVDDPRRARRLPSPQLVGSPDHETLDLNVLSDRGVQLVGRLVGARDGDALFSGSLRNVCALADLKMNRLLNTFDEWAECTGAAANVEAVERYAPTRVAQSPRMRLSFAADRIRNVVWATGFRPDYSWLDVPVLDRKGQLEHERGVVAPGLYVLGLPFMCRRKSSFMHGAEDDVREIGSHLGAYLDVHCGRDNGRIAV